MNIIYTFEFPDRVPEEFIIRFDDDTWEKLPMRVGKQPEWTELSFHTCPNCTLDPVTVSHCPYSVSIACIIDRFEALTSYGETTLTATIGERTFISETTIQRGLSSLLGLVIATSGCPHTEFLRPMAHFHLPLSSAEETIYRAVGMYYIGQFFRQTEDKNAEFDLSGLDALYADLETVNMNIAARLRRVTTKDAPINAIVLLDNLAKSMAIAIEEQLEEIRPFWKPYV